MLLFTLVLSQFQTLHSGGKSYISDDLLVKFKSGLCCLILHLQRKCKKSVKFKNGFHKVYYRFINGILLDIWV